MQKVLIITYYWPPGSGAGVQRWLKFSKYLPSFGWEPVILTVDPGYASYPAIDQSLEKDLPEGIKVYRTKATDYFRFYKRDKSKIPSAGFANSDENSFKARLLRFVRGNFFIPDPRKGWNKYAFRKACDLILSENIRHVITTSPPHSTQLIGLKLKKRYPSISWIADLRDPWTDIYYYSMFHHTCIARKIDLNYEKKVLENADRIITVGKSLKELLSAKGEGIAARTHVITNGYDEDDFSGKETVLPARFTISYIGTLSEAYPLEGFLEAVKLIQEKGITVSLAFIGFVSPGRREMIESHLPLWDLQFIRYVNHDEAIKYMLASSALLLIIPEHSSSRSILTGKLFEYIASGKPVICIGPPDGDAADVLESASAGKTFNGKSVNEIVLYIESIAKDKEKVKPAGEEYSRKTLTKHLASLFDS